MEEVSITHKSLSIGGSCAFPNTPQPFTDLYAVTFVIETRNRSLALKNRDALMAPRSHHCIYDV